MVAGSILIESIDSKLFDIENHIISITAKMKNKEPIVIDLNQEGPCATAAGLFFILDNLCDIFNYKKSDITIYTGNLLEISNNYNIKIYPSRKFGFYQQVRKNLQPYTETKTFNKEFKHFGSFVSRINWQRLWISSKLYSKYKEKTLMSFHYDKNNSYHLSSVLGLETIFNYNLQFNDKFQIDDLFQLLKNSPIKLSEKTEQYPLLTPENLDLAIYYKDFFVEIVYETYFSGNTFFPTEKIFRPIAYKTPFIVQGPRGFLDNMIKRGFKTFDKWWSEIYQDFTKLPTDCEIEWSTFEILKLIDSLANYDVKDLEEIYNDMKPTIEHNYELLLNG